MSPVRHKRPAVAAIDASGCLRSQHDAEFGRRRMPRSSRIGVCSSFAEGGMGVLFEVLDVRGSAPESRVQAADHFYCLKSRQAESGHVGSSFVPPSTRSMHREFHFLPMGDIDGQFKSGLATEYGAVASFQKRPRQVQQTGKRIAVVAWQWARTVEILCQSSDTFMKLYKVPQEVESLQTRRMQRFFASDPFRTAEAKPRCLYGCGRGIKSCQ
jgi:hypothetical protein